MRKEEAIEWMIFQKEQALAMSDGKPGTLTAAYDMAIEALSAETHEIRTETHGVCLINKEDAIESICDVVINEFDVCPTCGYDVAEKALSALPSVKPQEWIPCSERLPDKDGEYLVFYEEAVLGPFIEIMWYSKPSMPNMKVPGKCFYKSDSEWGDVVYDEISAWMPLPNSPEKENEE